MQSNFGEMNKIMTFDNQNVVANCEMITAQKRTKDSY